MSYSHVELPVSFPPLTALRAFEAVARLGSFNAAAEALFVTQSAVSHQVRHLESWLGRPLFDRSGARPTLLPRGEALARDLGLALGGIEAACARARAGDEGRALVIAAIPSVALCWLIPRLSSFRNAHPDIPVRIIYAIHGQGIDFREVDLAFTYAPAPPVLSGARTEPFLPGISVPVCNPAVAAGLSRDVGPAEAMLRAGLLHDTDTSGWAGWLARAGLETGTPLDGPAFEDFNLLRVAALSGQGIALCPAAMIRDDLKHDRLVQLSEQTARDGYGYYLHVAKAADPAMGPARDVFRDWALEMRDADEA